MSTPQLCTVCETGLIGKHTCDRCKEIFRRLEARFPEWTPYGNSTIEFTDEEILSWDI